MKYLYLIVLAIVLVGCQPDTTKDLEPNEVKIDKVEKPSNVTDPIQKEPQQDDLEKEPVEEIVVGNEESPQIEGTKVIETHGEIDPPPTEKPVLTEPLEMVVEGEVTEVYTSDIGVATAVILKTKAGSASDKAVAFLGEHSTVRFEGETNKLAVGSYVKVYSSEGVFASYPIQTRANEIVVQ